jgi:hypothetical protein
MWLRVRINDEDLPIGTSIFARATFRGSVIGMSHIYSQSGEYEHEFSLEEFVAQISVPWIDIITGQEAIIRFEFRRGFEQDWHLFAAASPTQWYVMFDRNDRIPGSGERFDFALRKVYEYCRNSTDLPISVARGIDSDLCYDPGQPLIGHPLEFYQAVGGVQCLQTAELMTYLVQASGVSAATLWYWCGSSTVRELYLHGVFYGRQHWVTFQLQAPLHDAAPLNPHFSFHALCHAGQLLDPSYGSIGAPYVMEENPGSAPQVGPQPPAIDHGWNVPCGHPYSSGGACP